MSERHERIALFIDGANFSHTLTELDLNLDYSLLLEAIEQNGTVQRAVYYTAIREDDRGFAPIRVLCDWLKSHGFSVVEKQAKKYTNSDGRVRTKGNMDIEMAVDILRMATSSRIEHIWLASGDGDFTYLVNAVQQLGVRVTVISTKKTNPPMCSEILRKQADNFIDIADLRKELVRR